MIQRPLKNRLAVLSRIQVAGVLIAAAASGSAGCTSSPKPEDAPKPEDSPKPAIQSCTDARICAAEQILRFESAKGAHDRFLNVRGDANPSLAPARIAPWNRRALLVSLPQVLLQERPKPFVVVDMFMRDASEPSSKANYSFSILISANGKARSVVVLPPCTASCAAVYSGPFDPSIPGALEKVIEILRGKALIQPGMDAEPDMLEAALVELAAIVKNLEGSGASKEK